MLLALQQFVFGHQTVLQIVSDPDRLQLARKSISQPAILAVPTMMAQTESMELPSHCEDADRERCSQKIFEGSCMQLARASLPVQCHATACVLRALHFKQRASW